MTQQMKNTSKINSSNNIFDETQFSFYNDKNNNKNNNKNNDTSYDKNNEKNNEKKYK